MKLLQKKDDKNLHSLNMRDAFLLLHLFAFYKYMQALPLCTQRTLEEEFIIKNVVFVDAKINAIKIIKKIKSNTNV